MQAEILVASSLSVAAGVGACLVARPLPHASERSLDCSCGLPCKVDLLESVNDASTGQVYEHGHFCIMFGLQYFSQGKLVRHRKNI